MPALAFASHKGHDECVDLLLAAGADVNTQASERGDTALHFAVYGDSLAVATKLLSTGKCNLQITRECTNKYTAHQYAYYNGQKEMATLIEKYAADPAAFGECTSFLLPPEIS